MKNTGMGKSVKIPGINRERKAVPGPGSYNPLNATIYTLPKKGAIIGSSRRTDFTKMGGVKNPGPQYFPELA
jgi:hypothetical protein